MARDPDALAEIESLLNRLGKEQQDSAVNSLHKKNMGKEMCMNIQIGNYEVDSVILDLGSDVNILTKKTWQKMGRLTLGRSHVQRWLGNQAKVKPIRPVSNLVVDVEGMNTNADFNVIEFVDGGGSYLVFLGIGWANDSMEMIKFKKWMMTFEKKDIWVIAPMDPNEGWQYIEPLKDEFIKRWDYA